MFRALLTIIIVVTSLYGCNADSEQPQEAEMIEIPASSAAPEELSKVVEGELQMQAAIPGAEKQGILSGDPGVLVYMSLDDNEVLSSAIDNTGNGYDGEITGAEYVAESVGGSGYSLEFDGVDDGVSLGALDVSGTGITLAAWVNADAFPGAAQDPRIISKASGTLANQHVFMLGTIKRGNETTLRGRLRVNGETHTLIADEGTSLVTGTWYHAALIHDGSRMNLYLNGVGVGGIDLAGDIDRDNTIGVAVGNNSDGSRPWDGRIDDVLIMERPLSAAELAVIVEDVAPDFTIDVSVPVEATEEQVDESIVVEATEERVDESIVVEATEERVDESIVVEATEERVDESIVVEATEEQVDESIVVEATEERVDESIVVEATEEQVDESVVVEATEEQVDESFLEEVTENQVGEPEENEFSEQTASPEEVLEQPILSNEAGVLVYLSFDEGETASIATDTSGNSNNGEIMGAVYVADSADGSPFSLDFDGVDDAVSLSSLDVSGTGLTLAAWVNADTFTGAFRDPRIISKASGAANDDHVFMLGTIKQGNETALRGRLRINGITHTLIADEGASLVTGTWYHAALVYDGVRMELYLNGEEVGGIDLAGDIDKDNTVGVAVGNNPDGARPWDGRIDEVLILERPISVAELAGIVEGAIAIDPMEVTEIVDSQSQIPTEEDGESPEEITAAENLTPTQSTDVKPILGALNSANNLAFPGALGWAADTTTGGRGGRVVIVDSLSNTVDPHDGVTTFREAMTEINEPRIIVFSVAGLIDYRSGPGIPNSQIIAKNSDSNVTVACQSAPPPGITLMGDGIRFAGDINNVILRHCRFRNSDPVNLGSAENSSCIRVIGSNPNAQGEVQRNFIVDHVSCMWAADDPVVFSTPLAASETGGSQKNITISNSIVSEGDADSLHHESGQLPNRYEHSHGPGCTSASAEDDIRIHRCSMVRNFISHNSRRNPQFWNVNEGEVINNIIYNHVEVGISALPQRGSVDGLIKGNLIQLGPTSKANAKVKAIDLRTNSSNLTISGNYLGEYGGNTVAPHDDPVSAEFAKPSTTQQVTPDLDILEVSQAGSNHLRCIGASRPRRDSHDQRVIDEFHQQSGQAGIMQQHERDFSEYLNGPIEHNWTDSDRDGMPDTWESKMGVDDPSRYDLSADYTNIEVYLNRLAMCPSVTFDAESVSAPAGTREIDIPFNTTWETWPDGQSFEVCVDNTCQIFNDPANSGNVRALLPADGEYQLTLTPVSSDGVRESIYGSIQLKVGISSAPGCVAEGFCQ